MKYLLDTCTFIWALEDSPELSKKVRALIEVSDGLYLSQTTLWEIAIKKTIKKLTLEETTHELVNLCNSSGIIILPIENNYFETIQKLPYIHGDPFDRLIMAAAIENDLIILTNDSKIRQYDAVKCLW